VRIVGHDGGAVARAAVAIVGGGPAESGFGGFLDVAEGTFSRPAAEPWDGGYEVFAAKDAHGEPLPYGPVVQRFPQDAPPAAVAEIVLPPERVVDGRVLGPDGNGVAGLELQATRVLGMMPHASAKTGPDGSFRLRNLGDREYLVVATPPPALLLSGDWSIPRGAATVELRLRTGVDVEVRVVDHAGKPVAGAMVSALARDRGVRGGSFSPASKTDADGRSTLRSLDPAASYRLSVQGPVDRLDLARHQQDGWTPAPTTVTLPRGFTVSGTVRDSTGSTFAGVVLRKKPDGSFEPLVGTDAAGEFRATGLPAGPLTVAAARGFGGTPGEAVTVEAGATGVILTVPGPPESR
jgi:hypothetical protein